MNFLNVIRHFLKLPMARAINESGERIESMRFTVPALRVGVLEYAPGQLQTSNTELEGKTVKLYYPPEAVSAERFLKSLETAPVVVGGHDSTTNEQNKKIDGWASEASYDNAQKAAIINGVVKGNKEIAYIKSNIGVNDFGASAFVDIHNLKIENGTTPDGQSYNAIAGDLRATHVALAPHVRDPQNKIKVINAVVINSSGKFNKEVKNVELTDEQIKAIVKNAVSEALAAKNADDEMEKLKAKNAEMEKELSELKKEKEGKAENEAFEGKETKEEEKEEEKEGDVVKNAKPAQAVVSAFATALNIDFGAKTPSFSDLAALSGITEEDPFKRITAVNAKFAELTAATNKTAETKNSVEVF